MIRIIDHKKIDLTDDEWRKYQEICKSYDTNTMQGKDLFRGLFQTNEEGIIIFLNPPTSRASSLEVFLFLMSIMEHQHLRRMDAKIDQAIVEMENRFNDLMTQMEQKWKNSSQSK